MNKQVYFEFGGMKFSQKTKSHICNNDGKVLCGVRSNWMEAGQRILDNGNLEHDSHLLITNINNPHACIKCLNKWKLETANHLSTK